MIIDLDTLKENQLFITESDAEFARLIGVSKQAVSAWIKDGKISIGMDGYLNPNKAISQLLKNANPAKLRSKALMPLIKQIKALNLMSKQKDLELAELKEDVDFSEESNHEFTKTLWAIKERLNAETKSLERYDTVQVINAFLLWLERYKENLNDNLTIIEFVDIAPVTEEKGAGF